MTLTQSQIAAVRRAYDALAAYRDGEHRALGLLGGHITPDPERIEEIDFILSELARIRGIERPKPKP